MRHRHGLLVDASLVVHIDPAAKAMHAALTALGYQLKPMAHGNIPRTGRAHVSLVWRRRYGGLSSSSVLNVTCDLARLG